MKSFTASPEIMAKYGMSPRQLQELVDEGVLAVDEKGQLYEVEENDDNDTEQTD